MFVLVGVEKLFAGVGVAPPGVLVGVGVRVKPDDGGCVLLPSEVGRGLLLSQPDRTSTTTLAINNIRFMERLISLNGAAQSARARHACSLANGSRAQTRTALEFPPHNAAGTI